MATREMFLPTTDSEIVEPISLHDGVAPALVPPTKSNGAKNGFFPVGKPFDLFADGDLRRCLCGQQLVERHSVNIVDDYHFDLSQRRWIRRVLNPNATLQGQHSAACENLSLGSRKASSLRQPTATEQSVAIAVIEPRLTVESRELGVGENRRFINVLSPALAQQI